MIAQIFAISSNNVIGKNNGLPWNLPNDLKYFKQKTEGHPVIMGRKTLESFGKPLKNRTNIVITRNPHYQPEGCLVFSSIEEAIEKAKEIDQQEIFIIGGAGVFEESLPFIDKIYVTEVKGSVDGDVIYNFDRAPWREVRRDDYHKDDKHAFDYSFVELQRLG